MVQSYASSITGSAIRVSRLDASGNIVAGETGSYVLDTFVSVSFTPEYEDGDEFVQKGANGQVCATFKAPDTLKRVTLEIAVCNPDPEFSEITSGGLLLTDGEESVGYGSALVGENGNPNGVALEVWSRAIQDGKPANTNPYWHWVFPYVILRPSGERVIENGIMANTYEGWGVGNLNFDTGPDGSFPFPTAANRPYLYHRTDTAPSGNGYVAVGGGEGEGGE